MNRAVNNKASGFTIVELLLAMTFVAILLLVIAITVIQIGNMYNRGLTLRSVDQSGRVITADIRRTINQSQPFSLENNYLSQKNPDSELSEPDGGRLCTGTYTYVWNIGKAIAAGSPVNVYDNGEEEIRLARVKDNGGVYCLLANATEPIIKDDAVELLSGGDVNLAIQSLSIEEIPSTFNVGQALYRIVLEIGTNDQDAINQDVTLNSIDTSCKPPSDDDSNLDFCAVNKFDFTALAGSKGGL